MYYIVFGFVIGIVSLSLSLLYASPPKSYSQISLLNFLKKRSQLLTYRALRSCQTLFLPSEGSAIKFDNNRIGEFLAQRESEVTQLLCQAVRKQLLQAFLTIRRLPKYSPSEWELQTEPELPTGEDTDSVVTYAHNRCSVDACTVSMSYADLVHSLQFKSRVPTCPYNISRELMQDIGDFAIRVQDVYINLSDEVSRLHSLCATQSIHIKKLDDEYRSVQRQLKNIEDSHKKVSEMSQLRAISCDSELSYQEQLAALEGSLEFVRLESHFTTAMLKDELEKSQHELNVVRRQLIDEICVKELVEQQYTMRDAQLRHALKSLDEIMHARVEDKRRSALVINTCRAHQRVSEDLEEELVVALRDRGWDITAEALLQSCGQISQYGKCEGLL